MKRNLKPLSFLLFVILNFGCLESSRNKQETGCNLNDLALVGEKCDSLRTLGMHEKAAQLYFESGKQNQSSELFVYAAWQYNEAQMQDSALLSVEQSITYGMSNPYILSKLGIGDQENQSNLRKGIEEKLVEIEESNKSIDNFGIITSPIDHFWRYFDLAIQDTSNAKHQLSRFICQGSPALRDYYHIRYENIDNMYHTMIKRHSDHYLHTRKIITDEKLEAVTNDVAQMMVRLSRIYPKAVFPKVYLVPGLINSSGTLTELGLFIGVEMFTKTPDMPDTRLSDWQKEHILHFDEMKYHLVHELMHFQQSYQDRNNRNLLLGKIIEEGSCDFLVSLLTKSGELSSSMRTRLDYLDEPGNLNFILQELKRDLCHKDLSKWMYNGGVIEDRPNDLGYAIGYKICESFYDNALDKEKAVFELLNTQDFKIIIEGSEYAHIL